MARLSASNAGSEVQRAYETLPPPPPPPLQNPLFIPFHETKQLLTIYGLREKLSFCSFDVFNDNGIIFGVANSCKEMSQT